MYSLPWTVDGKHEKKVLKRYEQKCRTFVIGNMMFKPVTNIITIMNYEMQKNLR